MINHDMSSQLLKDLEREINTAYGMGNQYEKERLKEAKRLIAELVRIWAVT